jgi:hypothetical protein
VQGSDEVVTVEMTLDEWIKLPPVQFVVKTELSRKQPRRPTKATDEAGAALPAGQPDTLESRRAFPRRIGDAPPRYLIASCNASR